MENRILTVGCVCVIGLHLRMFRSNERLISPAD